MVRNLLSKVLLCLLLVGVAFVPISVSAQDSDVSVQSLDEALPPTITRTQIEADIAALPDAEIAETARAEAEELLLRALARLEAAESYTAQAQGFRANTASHDMLLLDMTEQLEAIQAVLEAPLETSEAEMTNAQLTRMQQELRTLEGEAARLLAQIDRREQRLTTLAGRSDVARQTQISVDDAIDALNIQITQLRANGTSTTESQALLTSLFARRYAREQERLTLIAEIANIPLLQTQLNLAQQVARAQNRQVSRRIDALRDRMGLLRTREADNYIAQAHADIEQTAGAHPLLTTLAAQNLTDAQLLKSIAQAGDNASVLQARINDQLTQLRDDTALAEQITREGQIDRKYGAVLRRLRETLPNAKVLQNVIDTRNRVTLDLSMQRLLALDRLSEFTSGRYTWESALGDWAESNPDAIEPNEEELSELEGLLQRQRLLLADFVQSAGAKTTELSEINALQEEVLARTRTLSNLLDQRLLWLPSTEPLNFAWPKKVALGAAAIFAPRNLTVLPKTFIDSLSVHKFSTFLMLIFVGALALLKPRIERRMEAMKATVGRVQKDTIIDTPIAVLASIIRALPFCLLGIWVGFLFNVSTGNELTSRFGRAIMVVSILLAALLILKDWCRDGRLFDLHFKVRSHLRRRLLSHLPWFTGTQCFAAGLIVLCESYEGEQAEAALGLLGFLIGTLSIGIFVYLLVWSPAAKAERLVSADSFIGRHRTSIFTLALALPFITAGLAMVGYFATAMEVQNRLGMTVGLCVLAFVLYGVVRRTVVVVQRKLALEQARKRREELLREREARDAAESSGEEAPPAPKINYEEIDLEMLSRQSTQLLNIIVVIFVGALAWMLWDDLLPALSVFNDVKLPFDKMNLTVDGERVAQAATLWDLIQAVFAIVVTVIAAKNLPGFLDLFVLKRTGVTAGSRYAITTVLGYTIAIIGILVVSNQIGIEWSNLQWIIAALGVGVGFGLQEIIANFISGLIILFERPVRLGDYVTIGDQSGTVTRIQIRATTLSDLDNREILIPNRELIAGRVTNWTLSNSTIRIIVKVGIAYGSDTDKAQKIMLSTVKKIKGVLNTPEPQVLFLGFGDSSLDFEIRVFLPSFNSRFPVAHDVHTQINKALEKAGISIPYPQRDLHIVSAIPPKEVGV